MTTDTPPPYEQTQLLTGTACTHGGRSERVRERRYPPFQNMKTGLVCNDAFDPKIMDYDGDYNKEQDKSLLANGLLVQWPEQALAKLPHDFTIYVMNSNYFEEISHAVQQRL